MKKRPKGCYSNIFTPKDAEPSTRHSWALRFFARDDVAAHKAIFGLKKINLVKAFGFIACFSCEIALILRHYKSNPKHYVLMRILLCQILLIILVCSCNDGFDDAPCVPAGADINQNEELTVAEAKEKAIRIYKKVFFKGERTAKMKDGVGMSCSVEKSSIRNFSRSGGSQCYIVNFDDGGFVIIPSAKADDRVVGISEAGHFSYDPNNPDDIGNYIMTLAGDYLGEPINPIVPDSSLINPTRPHTSYVDTVMVGNRLAIRDSTVYYSGTLESYMVKTQWSEREPYNHYCIAPDGLPANTGCVAKACSQLCAYHKKPASFNGHTYNWPLIRSSKRDTELTPGALAAAELIHDIGQAIGTTYNSNGASYAPKSSGINLLRQIGYSQISYSTPYSFDVIMSQINQKLPVYIDGRVVGDEDDGHAWIIDGYYKETYQITYTFLDDNQTLTYPETLSSAMVHCNWGWGGQDDGFFMSGLFNTTWGNYSANVRMYYNIK